VRRSVSLLAAALVAAAQAPDKGPQVDAIFAGFTRDTPGCAVGVSLNGEVVLRAGYGMADLERSVPITPDSVFESGSVAKQFTAAALILLEQQGKLSLDDPMRKHLPELPEYGAPLTIRHVIHHTSGLREWRPLALFSGFPEGTRVYNNTDLLAFASHQKGLNFTPGTNYTYSNTGFNIAAILVERVLGGKTFQQYTKEAIFDPLEMRDTRWRDNFRAVIPRRAVAYEQSGGVWVQEMPIENIIGAGGMLTTVSDLLRWNGNFTHARVGGPDFVRKQQIPAKLASGRRIRYAAGLNIGSVGGVREVAHGGATGGYRTWLGRYPDKGVSVAVLCNSAGANTAVLGRRTAQLWTGATPSPAASNPPPGSAHAAANAGIYRRIRDNTVSKIEWKNGRLMLAGSPDQLTCDLAQTVRCAASGDDAAVYEKVEPVTPDAAALAAYVGEYQSSEVSGVIQISVQGGALRMEVGPAPAARLEPSFRDAFRLRDGSSIRFWRGDSGTVTGLSAGSDRVWDLRFTRVR